MLFVYWFLWPLRLVWLLVCCLYKEVYLQIFKCVSFWLHGCCGEWEGGPVNQVYHTSWVAVFTPTDRPKSVRNCCLIEHFCGVVCVVTLPFWHFCWCRGFYHRTGSDLLLFVFNQIWWCNFSTARVDRDILTNFHLIFKLASTSKVWHLNWNYV